MPFPIAVLEVKRSQDQPDCSDEIRRQREAENPDSFRTLSQLEKFGRGKDDERDAERDAQLHRRLHSLTHDRVLDREVVAEKSAPDLKYFQKLDGRH